MDKKPYKILKINYNTLSNYGDVFVVYANPPIEDLLEVGITSFSYSEDENTEVFIYPQDMSIINPIDSIGKSGRPWYPEPSEFRDGGLTFDRGRKIAHYHESLYAEDASSEAIINYAIRKIQFRGEWITLEDEQKEHWEFSIDEIRTPHGDLDIIGFMEVEQNGLVGVQLETDGYLDFSDFDDGYDGYVQTVAVMRQPNNVWLWLYLFDDNHQPIATICGSEEDIMANELSQFIIQLRKSSRYNNK